MLVWRIWYPLILPQLKISLVLITCLLGLVSILYEEIMSYCQNTNIQSENFHTNPTNFPFFPKANVKFSKNIFSPIYYTYICTYTILTSYTMLTLHLLALLTIHILQYNYTNQIELQLIYFCYCLHVNCSSHKEEFCLLITLHSKSKIGHCIYEVLLDLTRWIFNLKHTNI